LNNQIETNGVCMSNEFKRFNKNGAILLLIAGAFLFAKTTNAAPSISGTSGQVRHGDTVVISGSGFLDKSPAKPLLWADFENGFNPESLQNYGARLHYLLTLAEEFYHASQHMQGGNISPIVFVKEKLISNYFADFDLNQLPVEHVARSKPTILLEVDVYAKMLEVLGIEFVPKFIRLRYPSRDLVDIDRIVLEL